MIQLSNERAEQIIQEETKKTQPLPQLLRAIYTRYMNLYEDYIANMFDLTSEKVAEYKKQNDETICLVRYYFMDIPQDVCEGIFDFEEKVGDKLLGPEWKTNLYDAYEEFKDKSDEWDMTEDYYKGAFKKYALKEFYEVMENIFRDGFSTHSERAKNIFSGIKSLIFGGGGREK